MAKAAKRRAAAAPVVIVETKTPLTERIELFLDRRAVLLAIAFVLLGDAAHRQHLHGFQSHLRRARASGLRYAVAG